MGFPNPKTRRFGPSPTSPDQEFYYIIMSSGQPMVAHHDNNETDFASINNQLLSEVERNKGTRYQRITHHKSTHIIHIYTHWRIVFHIQIKVILTY